MSTTRNGLKNYGSNCFLNAVLQLLFVSDEIMGCITNQHILNIYENNGVDPGNIMKYLSDKYKIDSFEQQDACEILLYLLDEIEDKSLFEIKTKGVFTYNKPEFINDDDEVEFKQSESINISNELILSLELKNSISSSIDSYLSIDKETLLIDFESKKIDYSPQKVLIPDNSPKFIFISMKRFTYNNGIPVKLNDDIKITDYIQYNNYIYKVISYIVHIGDISNGHYFTFVKKSPDNFLIDDLSVKRCNNDDFKRVQKVAYVYLCEKITSI